MPDDLQKIKPPLIGYTGFVSAWRIDVDIIKHLAETCPDYSIVLVGPVDWLFRKEALTHLSNVHFLGGKPPEALANYIKYFDICINPQVMNEVTRGNYPRKADEYLAMEKPLVATVTEGMKMFEPYCFLCSTKEEYAEKIRYIITNPELANSSVAKQQRKAFALTHTWEESIGMLGDAYHSVTQKPVVNG